MVHTCLYVYTYVRHHFINDVENSILSCLHVEVHVPTHVVKGIGKLLSLLGRDGPRAVSAGSARNGRLIFHGERSQHTVPNTISTFLLLDLTPVDSPLVARLGEYIFHVRINCLSHPSLAPPPTSLPTTNCHPFFLPSSLLPSLLSFIDLHAVMSIMVSTWQQHELRANLSTFSHM